MSLRKIANELGISPAYLSYMVNGKRPWRRDLFLPYSYLVNTQGTGGNNIARSNGSEGTTQPSYDVQVAGARGSRTHRTNRRVAANGFEVREAHQGPSAPTTSWAGPVPQVATAQRAK